jgi:hypothetical protein
MVDWKIKQKMLIVHRFEVSDNSERPYNFPPNLAERELGVANAVSSRLEIRKRWPGIAGGVCACQAPDCRW